MSTFQARNKEISNFTRELLQLDTSILQTSHVKLSVSTRVIIAQNTHILRIFSECSVHMKLLRLYIKQIANSIMRILFVLGTVWPKISQGKWVRITNFHDNFVASNNKVQRTFLFWLKLSQIL